MVPSFEETRHPARKVRVCAKAFICKENVKAAGHRARYFLYATIIERWFCDFTSFWLSAINALTVNGLRSTGTPWLLSFS